MSLRGTNALLLVVGIALLVGVLYLASCFTEKISASRTAAILKRDELSWREVVCRPYTSGYWDYTCRVDSRLSGRLSFLVKVDASGIADQSAP